MYIQVHVALNHPSLEASMTHVPSPAFQRSRGQLDLTRNQFLPPGKVEEEQLVATGTSAGVAFMALDTVQWTQAVYSVQWTQVVSSVQWREVAVYTFEYWEE